MAITKEKKDELVNQYVELLKQSRAVFLTEYTGLDVKQMQELRSEIRKVDGAYHVTKNTLLRLALEQTGMPIPEELLSGQSGTGFALNEAPSVAKALTEFAKEQEELQIKGGILGNELLSTAQVKELADLPSLDELRSQIIGLIQAPARNIAMTLASGVRQVVNVLDAYSKLEQEADTEAAA